MAPPHIRLSKDGQTIEPERYVHTAPGAGNLPHVDSGRLVALLAEGATLVLQGVEDVAPRVRALSNSFRDALSARSHVNLYAGWRSENGFDLHWDPHEVMVSAAAWPQTLADLRSDPGAAARCRRTAQAHRRGRLGRSAEFGRYFYLPRGRAARRPSRQRTQHASDLRYRRCMGSTC